MEVCPVCRTDSFLNPRIRFLISPCYHWLCDSCVSRLFSHGSAPCPQCGTTLRSSSFSTPSFLDHRVEKECRIRRSLRGIMGSRKREDFGEAEEWEKWLEEVEERVARLVEVADVEEAGREVDELKRLYSSREPSREELPEVPNKRARVEQEPVVLPLVHNITPINLNRTLTRMESIMFTITNRHLMQYSVGVSQPANQITAPIL